MADRPPLPATVSTCTTCGAVITLAHTVFCARCQKAPPGPRLAALPALVPFRAFTPDDAAHQLAHLAGDTWLYEPGRPRYICALLGALYQELAPVRPDLLPLVLEAVWMARRMNDHGRRQEDLDWADEADALKARYGPRSLLEGRQLLRIRQEVAQVAGLPGDVAELGVYLGGVCKLIGDTAPDATLHAFDTFAGIPEDDAAAGGAHKRGDFRADADDVRAYLGNPRAVFHVGIFPGTTAGLGAVRFKFGHVDGDTYQTTVAACDWFGPRMVPGGVLVFDDYERPACPGVARAVHDRFPGRVEPGAGCQAVVRF